MGREIMTTAMSKLAELKKAIGLGEEGKKITFPREQAALAFRIKEESLQRLEYYGQEVVIRATNGNVDTELRTGEPGRREAYCLLHELILEARDGTADQKLKEIGRVPRLVAELLGQNLPFLKKHGKLDEDDLAFLHFKLFILRESLRDKTDLPPIESLFPTQFL